MRARIFALLLLMPGACATLDKHVDACFAMGGWPIYTKAWQRGKI